MSEFEKTEKQNDSFLLPASIYRLDKYVGLNGTEIVEEVDEKGPALMLCSDHLGSKFIVKFSDYHKKEDITMNDLQTFFKLKSEEKVDKGKILKIKDLLEDDDSFMDELDALIEEKDLGRKEAKEFEKKYIGDKAEELVFNFWLNKPGSWIRTTLNSTQLEYTLEGKSIPVYESKSIIYDGDKPSMSGMYYIAKTRHSLPIKMFTSKNDETKTVILFNNNTLTKTYLLTILRHLHRTVSKTGSFYLGFNFDKVSDSELEKLLIEIEKEDIKADSTKYLEVLDNLISYVEGLEENTSSFENVSIFLPGVLGNKIDLKAIIKDQSSLLYKYVQGYTNILHPYFKGNDEIISEIVSLVIDEVVNKRNPLYGFYEIVGSDSDELESSTYGWLQNNIKPSSIFMDVNKSIEMFHLINDKMTAMAIEKGLKVEKEGK